MGILVFLRAVNPCRWDTLHAGPVQRRDGGVLFSNRPIPYPVCIGCRRYTRFSFHKICRVPAAMAMPVRSWPFRAPWQRSAMGPGPVLSAAMVAPCAQKESDFHARHVLLDQDDGLPVMFCIFKDLSPRGLWKTPMSFGLVSGASHIPGFFFGCGMDWHGRQRRRKGCGGFCGGRHGTLPQEAQAAAPSIIQARPEAANRR
jgi:hypothetical protein